MDLEKIKEINRIEEKLYKDLEESLSEIDRELHQLDQKKDCFDVYKRYAWMISDYKAADNLEEFKREH